MELVLPGWFEADVSFLHLLTLWLLYVFVPLSLCTHHLVIDVADQLLGSLERKDKHHVDSHGWGKRGASVKLCLENKGKARLDWDELPVLCVGSLG